MNEVYGMVGVIDRAPGVTYFANDNFERQDTVGVYTQQQRGFNNIISGIGINHQNKVYTSNYPVKQKDRMVNMGQKYLQKIVNEEKKRDMDTVDMNPKVLSGMPVINGTRIQVSLILACLRDEMTINEICEDYFLEPQTVKNTLDFAIKVLDYPFYEE